MVRLIRVLPLLLLFALTGCSDLIKSEDERLSKEEAAARVDGIDYCAVYAWYGDGVCDLFCLENDPDCGQEPTPGPWPPEPQPLPPEPQPNPVVPEPFPCLAEDCGCPDAMREDVSYFSHDSLTCSEDYISQVCPPGTQNFTIEGCGCGCFGVPQCESTPIREYVGNLNECSTIFFACEPGWIHFEDECGCGCVRDTGPLCSPMEVRAVGPCDAELGVMFDGVECVTISGCSCEGPDCGRLYREVHECERATGDCSLKCGNPEGPVCDAGWQFGPELCEDGSVFTTINCATACVMPDTCEVVLRGGI